jgi:tetratricopeptide (TPR) repeat protein
MTGFVGALEHFAAEMDQEFSSVDLEALEDAGLLEIDDGWWRFRSDVVREVAYQTLTKTVRAQRHAGTAAVMLALPGAAPDQVAHHAATSAELVREIGPVPGVVPSIGDHAIQLLVRAVERSLDVGAFSSARRSATRALDLEPENPAVVRQLLLLRGQASVERRALEAAVLDARAVLDAAVEGGDARHEAIARRLLGVAAQMDGDLPRARRELGTSIAILRDLDDEGELATSLSDAGFTEVFGGSLHDAERLLAEAEELFVRLGDRRRHAWVRQHQAWVAFLSGDTALARERLEVANDVFEELGDESGSSWALGLLAYVYFMERDLDQATELATRVRSMSHDGGEAWAPAMMDSLLASIRLWSGDFAEADELSRRALISFREMGDRFGVVQALAPRMRALVALGRGHEAQQAMEEAMALSESFGDLAFPYMAAAGTAAHLGLGERAVHLGESSVERITRMGADGSEAKVTLALLLCQSGRAEEAITVLLEVTERTPYYHAVSALASALLGDGEAAVESADAVGASPGASYLDSVIAEIAAGAALMQCGDEESGRGRLATARRTADSVGDSVAHHLTVNASSVLTDPAAHPLGLDLAPGWRNVVDSLAGLVSRGDVVV